MPSAKKLPALTRQALEDPEILRRLLRSLLPENTNLRAREERIQGAPAAGSGAAGGSAAPLE